MRFDAKEFGGRIRDLRKKKGITQEQLSIMLNVSANHLAKVETGSRCCSIELLQDLSSCLNDPAATQSSSSGFTFQLLQDGSH